MPRVCSSSSGVAHHARGAGEGPAHAHALLLVDAERVGLDRQIVLQPALGHYEHLQRVPRLPQPQLEDLQGVIDGEHLVYEPGARAEERAHSSLSHSTQTLRLRPRNCAGRQTARLRPHGKQRRKRQPRACPASEDDKHRGRVRWDA